MVEPERGALGGSYLVGGDLRTARLGFGAMRLTGQPGNFGPYPDWEAGIALLRHAVESGVTFFDTARSYGPGWSEKLIAAALYPYPPELVIATKGGIDKVGPGQTVIDGSPGALRSHVQDALANLRVDRIDLFQLHRPDPNFPLSESVGALDAMRTEGIIRHIGLSNVTRQQLDEALAIAPIASVQNRYNQADRESDALVDYTAELGIGFLPWAPLGGDPQAPGGVLEPTEALAWLLNRSLNIIVIPGTTSRLHLDQNIAAAAAGRQF